MQAPILEGEYDVLSRIVKRTLRGRPRCASAQITDFATVQVDGWAVGQVAPAQSAGRLMRAVTYLVAGQTNFYGRPVEGVSRW